jgi:cell division transport system ATP-binding protein
VFQDFRLLPGKTVYENVAFALEVIGKPRHAIKQTVPEVLDLVGLAGKEKRLPHELSGGEQQRVAIARAFVNRPPILLADEPTGNLDPTTSLGIMRLLERINRTGTTVLMATHDDEIVNELRRRVIELVDGHVVRDEVSGTYGARERILPVAGATPVLDAPGMHNTGLVSAGMASGNYLRVGV